MLLPQAALDRRVAGRNGEGHHRPLRFEQPAAGRPHRQRGQEAGRPRRRRPGQAGRSFPTPIGRRSSNAFTAVATRKGDVVRGQQVFMKNCAVCHTFNARRRAGRPGPDGRDEREQDGYSDCRPRSQPLGRGELPALGRRQPKKGDTYSGRLVSETRTRSRCLTPRGKPHTILRDDVEKMAMQNKSIMPDGFESLGADQLTDVIEFLAQPKTCEAALGSKVNSEYLKGQRRWLRPIWAKRRSCFQQGAEVGN